MNIYLDTKHQISAPKSNEKEKSAHQLNVGKEVKSIRKVLFSIDYNCLVKFNMEMGGKPANRYQEPRLRLRRQFAAPPEAIAKQFDVR